MKQSQATQVRRARLAWIKEWHAQTLPYDGDRLYFMHRHGMGHGEHVGGQDCWCEPVLIRRSEFVTGDQAIDFIERFDLLN